MLTLLHSFSLGASLTAGANTLDGRDFSVSLPATLPAPVVILLHGNGGTGAPMLNSVKNGLP